MLDTWKKPNDVVPLELFNDWLKEPRNDSIYTGINIMAAEKNFRRKHPHNLEGEKAADAEFAQAKASPNIKGTDQKVVRH